MYQRAGVEVAKSAISSRFDFEFSSTRRGRESDALQPKGNRIALKNWV